MIIYAKPIRLLEFVPRDLISRTRSPPRVFVPWPPNLCRGWPFGSTTYIRRNLIFIIFFCRVIPLSSYRHSLCFYSRHSMLLRSGSCTGFVFSGSSRSARICLSIASLLLIVLLYKQQLPPSLFFCNRMVNFEVIDIQYLCS